MSRRSSWVVAGCCRASLRRILVHAFQSTVSSRSAQAFWRTVTVKIGYNDFRQTTHSRSQSAAVITNDDLRRAALKLIRSLFPPAKGIRLVGVTVPNFAELAAATAAEAVELPIFEGAAA